MNGCALEKGTMLKEMNHLNQSSIFSRYVSFHGGYNPSNKLPFNPHKGAHQAWSFLLCNKTALSLRSGKLPKLSWLIWVLVSYISATNIGDDPPSSCQHMKKYCGCSHFKPPVSHWVTSRDQHTYSNKIKALYGPKWHIDRMFHSQIHSLYEGIALSNMPNPPCIHGSTHQKFRPGPLMHPVTHISSSWLFISSCKTKQNMCFASKKLP